MDGRPLLRGRGYVDGGPGGVLNVGGKEDTTDGEVARRNRTGAHGSPCMEDSVGTGKTAFGRTEQWKIKDGLGHWAGLCRSGHKE